MTTTQLIAATKFWTNFNIELLLRILIEKKNKMETTKKLEIATAAKSLIKNIKLIKKRIKVSIHRRKDLENKVRKFNRQ